MARVSDSNGAAVVRTTEGAWPRAHLQLAATCLASGLLEEVADGVPCSPALADAILRLYRARYGADPEHHWASVLLQEVEKAKRQALANPNVGHDGGAAPKRTVIEYQSGKSGSPGAKLRKIKADTIAEYTPKGRRLLHLYRIYKGERRYLATIVQSDEVAPEYPGEGEERARAILNIVRQQLATLLIPQALPEYADDNLLVAWLFERMGFDGGGGQSHTSTATLLRWLTNPVKLAAEIQAFAKRRAERADDEMATQIEEGLMALAGRIRERAPRE